MIIWVAVLTGWLYKAGIALFYVIAAVPGYLFVFCREPWKHSLGLASC